MVNKMSHHSDHKWNISHIHPVMNAWNWSWQATTRLPYLTGVFGRTILWIPKDLLLIQKVFQIRTNVMYCQWV